MIIAPEFYLVWEEMILSGQVEPDRLGEIVREDAAFLAWLTVRATLRQSLEEPQP